MVPTVVAGGVGLFLVRTRLVSVNDAEVVLVAAQRHGIIAILVSVPARFANVFAGSAGVVRLVVVFLVAPV
jgi:hypothetical protein